MSRTFEEGDTAAEVIDKSDTFILWAASENEDGETFESIRRGDSSSDAELDMNLLMQVKEEIGKLFEDLLGVE